MARFTNLLQLALSILVLAKMCVAETVTGTNVNVLQNKKWILKSHPNGEFNAERDLELTEECIDLDKDVSTDQIVVEVQALSIDAFIRTLVSSSRDAINALLVE